MAERKQLAKEQPPSKLERYRARLAIDQDKMDEVVAEQPELFDHVADAYVTAAAERDAIKLEIEEMEADEEKRIREKAAAAEEKLTEKAITSLLAAHPKIRTLKRELLAAKEQADRWAALEKSYGQRSYMIRELVPLYLSRLFSKSSVRGAEGALADNIREQHMEARLRKPLRYGRNSDTD